MNYALFCLFVIAYMILYGYFKLDITEIKITLLIFVVSDTGLIKNDKKFKRYKLFITQDFLIKFNLKLNTYTSTKTPNILLLFNILNFAI
jgi:hypothetical protein